MISTFVRRALLGVSALLLVSTSAFAQVTPSQKPTAAPAPPIVVTGTLESRDLRSLETPSLGVSIDSDQIDAVNAVNTEDVIRYAPNLIVRKRYIGDANATLSFRNMHTTQTPRALVTVDGFLISDFLGADFDTAPKWAVLSPTDIARAEIVYGPTSARYSGNALGGVLRLETAPIRGNAVTLGAQGFYQHYGYYDTDEDLYGFALDGQGRKMSKSLGNTIDPLKVIPPYGPRNPQWYGIFEDNDPTKRLMVVFNFNNDIAEYWEYSDQGYYPIELSNEAYKLGVNYIVYGHTH